MKKREQWFKQHEDQIREIDHDDEEYALGNFQEESRFGEYGEDWNDFEVGSFNARIQRSDTLSGLRKQSLTREDVLPNPTSLGSLSERDRQGSRGRIRSESRASSGGDDAQGVRFERKRRAGVCRS